MVVCGFDRGGVITKVVLGGAVSRDDNVVRGGAFGRQSGDGHQGGVPGFVPGVGLVARQSRVFGRAHLADREDQAVRQGDLQSDRGTEKVSGSERCMKSQ